MLRRMLAGTALLLGLGLPALADGRPLILLINPNSSDTATQAMTALAQAEAGARAEVVGLSNAGAPALLKTPADMAAAAEGVVRLGTAPVEGRTPDAIIVSAFSDPGLKALRAATPVPVFGIGEAAFAEAARDGRSYAIVAITPDPALIQSFADRAAALGHGAHYLGTVVTPGDPEALLADPAALALDAALEKAVAEAAAKGAQAVIMGADRCRPRPSG